MDVQKAFQFYINKILNDIHGMKILLLDAETTGMLSLVYTQSQLLEKEVYLVDRIDYHDRRDNMKHLNCICLVRPTIESLQALELEIRNPHYGASIEKLAEVDEQEVVKEVQEYYADFYAVNNDLFSLNINRCIGNDPNLWDGNAFQRSVDGLLALLLSLKKKPTIRYEKSSTLAMRLAQEIKFQMDKEQLMFDFRKSDVSPLLIILDRRNDPITPLLTPWTYQAMVHELIGINNGRVDMTSVPNIKAEMKEIVLNGEIDSFYKKNMFLNLGDLGANIKEYVLEYQTKTKSSKEIESLSDMKKFIEEYPEFRKLSGNVSKHVTLVSYLSSIVEERDLLHLSEIEQSIACTDNRLNDFKNICSAIENEKIKDDNKVRLVMIYALRYEKVPNNQLNILIENLQKRNIPERKINWIKGVLDYATSEVRHTELFSLDNIINKGRSALKGLQGVENIYTQHNPNLSQTLELLIKSKLKENLYPYVENSQQLKERPQDIVIYFVNGCTFEEAKIVSNFNQQMPGIRLILGGSTIHNTKSFIKDIEDSLNSEML
ncbi:Sec1-like 2 domain-containing protein [Rozella allomycis CSF55]|uniref:Sec1-like 2 domain-containing protein n=1 Tax=Rozella allomycis (strain CSF55) TaxID=988480 RepID=A0A075B260_ROZAC|nr:Sec1-like 2 domain-containing protein [Rozella allomycis CSF55]|eukprot:EPZ35056.1 Sec1-like 2 domain-containing protein [Rozella allomycis CSF55]